MTHTHDRTLLAQLGFADPDKNDAMHDLVCEYLAEKLEKERIRVIRIGPKFREWFERRSVRSTPKLTEI